MTKFNYNKSNIATVNRKTYTKAFLFNLKWPHNVQKTLDGFISKVFLQFMFILRK